jgi:mycothiol synthase
MSTSSPQSYTLRQATRDDAQAIADLINACSIERTGSALITVQHIYGQMQTPGFDLETDSVVTVGPEERLLGYAVMQDMAPHTMLFALVDVHPQYEGQGVGSHLCQWVEERGHRSTPLAPAGERVVLVQKRANRNETARRLLMGHGYRVVRHNYRMIVELDEPPPLPDAPDGIAIRPFVRDQEAHTLVETLREVFCDSWGYVDRPFEEEYQRWMHILDRDADNDPAPFWFVALDGPEIAGFCLGNRKEGANEDTAWIHVVGVRPNWRRRGLALALLRTAFGALYEQGSRRIGLEVDTQNPTGATRLYEKAGMQVERHYDFFERELRPSGETGRS